MRFQLFAVTAYSLCITRMCVYLLQDKDKRPASAIEKKVLYGVCKTNKSNHLEIADNASMLL